MKLSKNIILTTFIILTIFLININQVNAYNNSTLQLYHTFGDANNTYTVYDSVNGIFAYASTSATSIAPTTLQTYTGKVGNTLNGAPNRFLLNTNYSGFDATDFTINYWFKDEDGASAVTTHFKIGYTGSWAYGTRTFNNDGTLINQISFDDDSTNYITLNTTLNSSNWNMLSFIFDDITNIVQYYVNGVYIGNATASERLNSGSSWYQFLYTNYNLKIDEFALFYSKLNSTDITILYNNGTGLTYAQTMSSGNGFVNSTSNTTIPPETTDEYLNVCVLGNFNELGSRNILCNHAYTNSTVGAFYCPIANQEWCTVTCTDTLDYWSSIGQSPIDMNYNGTCGTTLFTCGNLGQRKCNNDGVSIAQCKEDPNGVGYIWVTTTFCPSSYTCNNGYCIAPTTTPINATATQIFWGGDTLSSSTKMLIALLIMVITIITFTVIGGNAMSIKLGLIIGTILAVFEFIFFTILGWFDTWILIVVVMISVAIIILIPMLFKGGNDGV